MKVAYYSTSNSWTVGILYITSPALKSSSPINSRVSFNVFSVKFLLIELKRSILS